MKREELIAQLELLPEGAEVFVRRGERIAEPHLCIYSVQPHPEPEKLVVYLETFYDALAERGSQELADVYLMQLTDPCHDHLFHVCHHGRDIMGTCGGCFTEEEDCEEDEECE